ncbi:MAG: hypothetical protein ACO2PO_09945 [Candidatus Calescibacterium sp.]|jgi:hypothetical protein
MLEKLILFQADLIEQLCYLIAITSIFAYLTKEECYERIVETIAMSLEVKNLWKNKGKARVVQ